MSRLCEELVVKLRRLGKVSPNNHGGAIYRYFDSADRYVVDFADDFKDEGWVQFDTDQDAPYFGVWVNPSKLLVLTYAEGDWSLSENPSVVAYNDEIDAMCKFYGKGFEFKTIDERGIREYRQDRSVFKIAEHSEAFHAEGI